MNPLTLKALCGAYGMELQFERPEECKLRFRGNGTFIDVWHGKRGLTLGVYDKAINSMRYHRSQNLLKLEKILIALHEAFGG